MEFQLDIYTWPAMTGVNPEIRSSRHETAQNAVTHLEAESQPYAYAVLLREIEKGRFEACDWDGQLLIREQQWPQRTGENGTHPAIFALKEDWDNLIALVRNQYDGTRGMICIAGELLGKRHPDVQGYAKKLAWAAAE